MFVHAGFFHLFGNMIYLFLFGCCVEDLVGRARYLVFYLLGGFVAELFFIGTLPLHFASHVHLGGASGAISACMGMYLCLRANSDITFKYFYFLFSRADYGEWEIPAWLVICFWFLEDLFWMLVDMWFPRLHGGTAFGAHVGGFLAGMALITLFRLGARKTAVKDPAAPILSPEEIAATTDRARRPTTAEVEIPTIYLHSDGVQSGPFTLDQIQLRLARQELGADTRYWSEGMSQWESVQDLADRPLP
jgi:membrane associated rhomboid family serine protease